MAVYFNDIQILRCVLLVIILLFHQDILKNGFIGVDLFFSITGFLMCYKIDKMDVNHFDFYASRIRRIIPLYYFSLTVFVLILYIGMTTEDRTSLLSEYNRGLLFISNYYYENKMKQSSSYSFNLNHLWVISIEMQYYLLCPLTVYYPIVNYIIFIISLAIYYYMNVMKVSTFYSFIARIFEFNIGVFSYMQQREISNLFYSIGFKTISLIAIILLSFFSPNISYLLYQINIIPIAMLFSFLYLFCRNPSIKITLLDYIGELSFSIYLVYYPLKKIFPQWYYYLPILIISSIIINYGDKYLLKFLKEKESLIIYDIYLSLLLLCLLLSYALTQANYTLSVSKSDYQYKSVNLKSYSCYYKNIKGNSLIVIGDSITFPLIGLVINYCKRRGIYLYYKYIHTQYIIDNNKQYLEDININFCVVIIRTLLDKYYINNTYNYSINMNNYLHYLLKYSKHVIFVLPTPVFNKKEFSCFEQKKKKFAVIGSEIYKYSIDISKIESNKRIDIIDITSSYCDNKICNLTYKGDCLYVNNNLLKNEYYIPFISSFIDITKHFCLYNQIKDNNNVNFYLYNNNIHRKWIMDKKGCKINYLSVPYRS